MTAAIQSKLKLATNPYVGIVGVFLGATLATMNARLLSVGLPDLRGALGLGFDQASWLPTALNMATMFSGIFVVFVNTLLGPRRILIPASLVFALVSALLPLAHGYGHMLALIVIAGLSSGTFYSLTMTFVLNALPKKLIIFGVAAYAADIVFTANVAPALEAWYIGHLSWHWIYWNSAVLAPLMTLCVYYGIPRVPLPAQRPSWRGFTYFSVGLSLIYGALDQGERLYWLHSGVIVGMLSAGTRPYSGFISQTVGPAAAGSGSRIPKHEETSLSLDYRSSFSSSLNLRLSFWCPVFSKIFMTTGRFRSATHWLG